MRALAELKATGQDYEWYPTTDEIIAVFHKHLSQRRPESILDIGAGNGKVLGRFEELNKRDPDYHTEYFAIEKARPLLDSLPVDVGILGTDFWEQSLLDKSVDCIFSNPPYSEFIEWCAKIIREANANYIYLVIPQRWKTQQAILTAIEARKATHKVIGEFDFLNSEDRTARVKVDLVFISLCEEGYRSKYRRNGSIDSKVDPFALWVEDFFQLSEKVSKQDVSDYDKKRERKANINNQIVPGKSTIEVLDTLYRAELDVLIENYRNVSKLDGVLFKELDISIKSIVSSIRVKIKGLKNAYWHELFDNYKPLTSRLTASSRAAFIESITRKTSIDFTASNAYAITVWAIRNADGYLDSQMIETFNKMVDSACVINYKSNERVFKKNTHRYYYDDNKHTHFKLDYRIVVERMGGLCREGYRYDHGSRGGLSESAANFLDDLLVIAKNLGFDSSDTVLNHNFTAGGKEEFFCTSKAGKNLKLMEVRAYMNGNLHIKFNQAFMLTLNVEIGRLQGWIHNAQHAAEEMGEDVSEVFGTAYSLSNTDDVIRLLT